MGKNIILTCKGNNNINPENNGAGLGICGMKVVGGRGNTRRCREGGIERGRQGGCGERDDTCGGRQGGGVGGGK